MQLTFCLVIKKNCYAIEFLSLPYVLVIALEEFTNEVRKKSGLRNPFLITGFRRKAKKRLLLHNTSGHPEKLYSDDKKIVVMFQLPNVTSFVQPMDQNVIQRSSCITDSVCYF